MTRTAISDGFNTLHTVEHGLRRRGCVSGSRLQTKRIRTLAAGLSSRHCTDGSRPEGLDQVQSSSTI